MSQHEPGAPSTGQDPQSSAGFVQPDGTFSTALTGGRVDYYLARIEHPQRETQAPYTAECEDIIEALGMTFDEGCEFKAIWRTAAARQARGKPGHSAVYDAQKRVHYAQRSLRRERILAGGSDG